MKKFKELTSEIEEAVIKRLDLGKLRKRSREQSIRMRRLMKNPAYKKKVELKKKRMKSAPELLVRAQKQARDMVRVTRDMMRVPSTGASTCFGILGSSESPPLSCSLP